MPNPREWVLLQKMQRVCPRGFGGTPHSPTPVYED